MKVLRVLLCIGMICFLAFAPQPLVRGAQESFVDARFVRDRDRYKGVIVLYHIVRHKPYAGSLTQWLKERAAEYEKKHKGIYIEIEGMDEKHFYERLENGRRPDAYSFFSGTLYKDRLSNIDDLMFPYRSGLFQTDRCVPYCYTGYCRLVKTADASEDKTYYANDLLAARDEDQKADASEEKADVLYLDMRRAGDLIRYRDGFTTSVIEPIDNFTDAVCWLGIDRETDTQKSAAILGFLSYLMEPESQQTLNALGLLSVRSDVRNHPPEAGLKKVFRVYDTVQTVDPFIWNASYNALKEDASLSREGDGEARERFNKRLRECCR